MNKLNVGKLFKDIQTIASKHSPEILTGIGIAGMITTTVLAVRATPKALELIEDKQEELYPDSTEKLSAVEVVKTTWKCYVPAALTGTMATACLIGANSVNARRNAALATAYNITASTLAEYKDKVIETIGERKEEAIRDKIAEDRLKKEPVNRSTVIITDTGKTRFYDDISKRRFTSDIVTLRNIALDLNGRMMDGEDCVSLNDFYYELGLEGISFGDELGWNVSKNGRAGQIKIDFSAIVDTDGQPTIVLEYSVAPTRGYDRY